MDKAPWPTQVATWLIDGYNVLHAGMLHREDRVRWWTRHHRDRLTERAGRLETNAHEIWIAFDGDDEGERTLSPIEPDPPSHPQKSPRPPKVRIFYARSADAWILERVRKAANPQEVVVVTADRKVADKAHHRGAQIVSPRAFLDHCPGASPTDAS